MRESSSPQRKPMAVSACLAVSRGGLKENARRGAAPRRSCSAGQTAPGAGPPGATICLPSFSIAGSSPPKGRFWPSRRTALSRVARAAKDTADRNCVFAHQRLAVFEGDGLGVARCRSAAGGRTADSDLGALGRYVGLPALAALSTTLLAAGAARVENVEVCLTDRLDNIQAGCCLDISGGQGANPTRTTAFRAPLATAPAVNASSPRPLPPANLPTGCTTCPRLMPADVC